MNLVFVGHRCCDHSPSSGYDQICSLFPEAGWLHGPQLAAGQLAWIREPTSQHVASQQVFHVFYGDCSGSALPALLRERFPQATIVSTVHQPVSRLKRDSAGWASLHAVDGIITVSETQANQLADLGLALSIHTVPHGVWTQVFRPDPTFSSPRDSVLMVGSYLRDWDGTRRIVELLAAAGVRTVVLGSNNRLTINSPLVVTPPRVSETELARLYDRAAALILPVLDATASNALLEAMAAGCPVICPRLPSLVDEYIGDDADAYGQGEHHTAVARAIRFISEPDYRAIRSHTLRKRVQMFDWAGLRSPLAATYREITARQHARNTYHRPVGRSTTAPA